MKEQHKYYSDKESRWRVSNIILTGVSNILTADTHKIIFWPVGSSGEGTLRIIRSIEPGAAETPAAGKRSLVSSFASFLPTYKSKTSAAAKISKADTTDELWEAMLTMLTIDNNNDNRPTGWSRSNPVFVLWVEA